MNPARHRRHFTLRAEGLQDHVTKHVRLGFRLTDLTNINQLLHERLVLRRESNLVLANDIAAAVADLHEVETCTTNGSSGERRTHARATRVFLAPQMNGGVGVVSRVLQTFDEVEIRIAVLIAFADEHLVH